MGMEIEKAILQLEECKAYKQCDTEKDLHAFDVAINIMHKYQKITEIYERFQKDGSYYHHMAWLDVMEVLEDGNSY